jgi:hypothetical protein
VADSQAPAWKAVLTHILGCHQSSICFAGRQYMVEAPLSPLPCRFLGVVSVVSFLYYSRRVRQWDQHLNGTTAEYLRSTFPMRILLCCWRCTVSEVHGRRAGSRNPQTSPPKSMCTAGEVALQPSGPQFRGVACGEKVQSIDDRLSTSVRRHVDRAWRTLL